MNNLNRFVPALMLSVWVILLSCSEDDSGIGILRFNESETISLENPFYHIAYNRDNEEVEKLIKLINSLDEPDITEITSFDSSLVTGYVNFSVDKGAILDMISVQSLSDGRCIFRWIEHDSRAQTQTILHFFQFIDPECSSLIAKIQEFYGYEK